MPSRPPPGTSEPVGTSFSVAYARARQQFFAGLITLAELRLVQQHAILEMLALHAKALGERSRGPVVVSDAGLRSIYGDVDFFAKFGGLALKFPGKAVTQTGKASAAKLARTLPTPPHGDPSMPTLQWVGPLKHVQPILVDDGKFLLEAAQGYFRKPLVKTYMPAPTMLHRYLTRSMKFKRHYSDLNLFYRDLTQVYVDELKALKAAELNYVQLNDDNLAMLCAGFQGALGTTRVLGYAALINRLAKHKPAGMTLALHLRRDVSAPLPEMVDVLTLLVANLDIPIVMVDYEQPSSADLAWLSSLQTDVIAVVGLVNVERLAMETSADVQASLRLAAQHTTSMDSLALGVFGSGMEALRLGAPASQWSDKMAFGASVARAMWPYP